VIALVLGGANSGKSEVAEHLAGTLSTPVTYVATWVGDDPQMQAKVDAHRARRPASWTTIEGGDLVAIVTTQPGTLLVDSLGTWVASSATLAVDGDALCRALASRGGDTVLVSDEVGLGVHPSTEAGRRFRETLGAVNRAVAAVADRKWLVVAGQALELGPSPTSALR
jgi:adenosyl cobinamide kinase/adenosyl cobinamide phosphate guanylyltransferase